MTKPALKIVNSVQENSARKEHREDVHTTESKRGGFAGLFETTVRKFKVAGFMLVISMFLVLVCLTMGTAIAPAIALFKFVQFHIRNLSEPLQYLVLGWTAALCYFTYGLTLIFVAPLVNFIFPWKVKPFRGPYFSLPAIPWYVHNGLTYIVRYTFLEFLTPTPLNILFYQMMGMKVGKGVVINSTHISDPCMITLGDHVTIGGSATLFAHYGQKGYLIIAPTIIGNGANIGLKASIMGGVTVGEGAMVKAHASVMPKTVIPPGETF